MAQAIKNKDVRKNCVDVEKVITEYLHEPEREENGKKPEPMDIKTLSKELSKFLIGNNARYNQELIHINQVKQNLVFKNYNEYNM